MRGLKKAGYKTAALKLYFTACIRSILEYGCQLWSTSLTECQINALEDIQKRACRIITGTSQLDYSMQFLNLEPLAHRHEDIAKSFFHQIFNLTSCLHDLLPAPQNVNIMSRLRSVNNLPIFAPRTEHFRKSIIQWGLMHW